MAKRRGILNVSFKESDITKAPPAGSFDAVVDTQTLLGTSNLKSSLQYVDQAMEPNGLLISVAAARTFQEAGKFVQALHNNQRSLQ